jgi:hypothetical protein
MVAQKARRATYDREKRLKQQQQRYNLIKKLNFYTKVKVCDLANYCIKFYFTLLNIVFIIESFKNNSNLFIYSNLYMVSMWF